MEIRISNSGLPEVHSNKQHRWTGPQLDAAVLAGVAKLCRAQGADQKYPSICTSALLTLAFTALKVSRAILALGDAASVRRQYGELVEAVKFESELLSQLVRTRTGQNPPPPAPPPVKVIRRRDAETFEMTEEG